MTPPSPPSVPGGRIQVWDLPLRLFHWLLVIAIALAFLSSEEDSALNHWHVLSGWVAGLLIVFRIAWGFVGGEHARFSSFVRPSLVARHISELLRGHPAPTLGHNALGAFSVILLLFLVGATVITGAIVAEEIHELIAWTLLGLVALHVAAVILMSFLTHENLVSAMLRGSKLSRIHPGRSDARAAGPVAILITAFVLAGTVWGITSYDPQAFTLRSAEDYEHRGEAGAHGRGDSDAHMRRPGRHEGED
jgi:cytochrome b